MIYRAICERLEMIDRIPDASKCFLQMEHELTGEMATHRERAEWVVGETSCILLQTAF